jgi:hypothetical protein
MAVGAVLVAGVSSARAVDVVFSADLQSTENPTIYANVGDRVSVWMVAKTTGSSGYADAINVNIRAQSIDGGAYMYPFFDLLNPHYDLPSPTRDDFRWDLFGVGGYDVNGVAVYDAGGSASRYRPGLSVEQDWRLLGSFYITVAHEGTMQFYLQVGDHGISESDGVPISHFGWGDGPVVNVAGAESAVADLTVISPMPPLPEPGVVGVVGVAGVVAMGRRRA